MATLNKQFIFIVGSPRSGTSWLHTMLREHPQVAAIQAELTVFTYLGHLDHRFQSEKHHLDQGHWQQGAPLLFQEDEFYHSLRSLADEAYSRVLKFNPEATHILDKHPAYALQLPLIYRLYPQCKVIHIIRDGREVAVSMMSAKRRIGFGAGEIRGASREWHRHITQARIAGVSMGLQRYMEVRYEDLVEHTATELERVFAFSGLSLSEDETIRIAQENHIDRKQVSSGDAQLNALRATPHAIWKTKLSLEERWTMDRMVGALLFELGYAEHGWWALNRTDRLKMYFHPFLQRILWSIGNLLHVWRTPVVDRIQ